MLFNSWSFPLFLAIIFCAHFRVAPLFKNRAGAQLSMLIFASFVFYGYGNPRLIFLLAASISINGMATRFLLSGGKSPRARRAVCALAIGANLAGIAFFKYAGLMAATFLPATTLRWVAPWLASIPLPLGISFYTFEGLSLVVDAYNGRKEGFDTLRSDLVARPATFFGRVALFITFFPHLVAGPIVRGYDFIDQIGRKTIADIDWYYVVRKLVLGFFLKMVVADNLKEATAGLTYPNFLLLSKTDLVFLLYGYSFQIFADFCGYSLIAMGLAALFGYRFPVNFDLPYISASLTEFWRRWHISLSTWLRDYLYIPLGGNRKGRARSYLNLFIVMFLGGLWHGAAWSYAIWGSAHGIFLALERFFRNAAGSDPDAPASRLITSLRIFLVFNIVSILWLLFKLPNFHEVGMYFSTLAHAGWKPKPQGIFTILLFSTPVVLMHAWGLCGSLWRALEEKAGVARALCENTLLGTMLFLIIVNSGTSGSFIYFQF